MQVLVIISFAPNFMSAAIFMVALCLHIWNKKLTIVTWPTEPPSNFAWGCFNMTMFYPTLYLQKDQEPHFTGASRGLPINHISHCIFSFVTISLNPWLWPLSEKLWIWLYCWLCQSVKEGNRYQVKLWPGNTCLSPFVRSWRQHNNKGCSGSQDKGHQDNFILVIILKYWSHFTTTQLLHNTMITPAPHSHFRGQLY